jgi:hypothetical protein
MSERDDIRREILSALKKEYLEDETLLDKVKQELPDLGKGWKSKIRNEIKILLNQDNRIERKKRILGMVGDQVPVTDEAQLYRPFAEFLEKDVHECTNAIKLGGNVLQEKWGTPDVVGYFRVSPGVKYKSQQIVSFVSAEIKSDPNKPVEAFGQACAYLRFSHKVYLVLPLTITEDDKQLIETLCGIVHIGLVFFDPSDKKNPRFQIRMRPEPHEPDPIMLNVVLDKLDSRFK